MKPSNLTPEEKPQTLELIPDNDEHQGSDFIPKADSIDSSGKPTNQQSITDLLIKLEVLLSQGGGSKLDKVI